MLSLESSLYTRFLSLPLVHTEHSLFPTHDIATLNLSAAQGYLLGGRMQRVVGVSAVAAAGYGRRTGVGRGRIKVVKNAIDAEGFGRRREEGGEGRIRVGTLGRLTYRKGTDLLVRVIPEICEQYPEVEWVVGGDGKKGTLVRETVELHNLESRVTFLGRVDQCDVKSILGEVDVFLNTSLTESFCLSVLEAKASGCVVVTTDVGGVREVFDYDNGCEGVVFVDVDVGGVLEGLGRGIEIHRGLVEGGERGGKARRWREEIGRVYDWGKVATEVEEVYREVMEERERGGKESLWDVIDEWGEGKTRWRKEEPSASHFEERNLLLVVLLLATLTDNPLLVASLLAGRTFLETAVAVAVGAFVYTVMQGWAWWSGELWEWRKAEHKKSRPRRSSSRKPIKGR